jgi:phosphonate transport system substrate-binding protein
MRVNDHLSSLLRGPALFFLICICLLLGSCNQDPEAVLVDFTKTRPVQKPDTSESSSSSIKVAIAAMFSPKDTFQYYRDLLDYLGRRTGLKIELIQRKTYGEINRMLAEGQLHLAFVCSGPYATGRSQYGFQALVTPQIHGSTHYQSYVIVHKESPFETFEELKGMVFAFTDPESNTGKLVPTFWLAQMGERPETFFKKIIYTYSHDNSLVAVARHLVDGASVDSLIWEYYLRTHPQLTSQTRVIRKSDPYGNPPLVSAGTLSPEIRNRVIHVLLTMHEDAEGRQILSKVMIDRFVPPRDEWYDGIRQMWLTLAPGNEKYNVFSEHQK